MTPRHPTACAVIARVAALYGVDEGLLWGKSRFRTVTEARHLAWWHLHQRTAWSSWEVAIAVGADHSTVLLARKKTAAKIMRGQGTPAFQSAVKVLQTCLEAAE